MSGRGWAWIVRERDDFGEDLALFPWATKPEQTRGGSWVQTNPEGEPDYGIGLCGPAFFRTVNVPRADLPPGVPVRMRIILEPLGEGES